MYLVDQSKYICKTIASCINLQLLIPFFVKSILPDIHHRITYMYINFEQNRVNIDQSKPCTQMCLQEISQVALICNYQYYFFFDRQLQIYIIVKLTCMSMFIKIGYSRPVKTVHTNLFAQIANYINLQLAIKIVKTHALLTYTNP